MPIKDPKKRREYFKKYKVDNSEKLKKQSKQYYNSRKEDVVAYHRTVDGLVSKMMGSMVRSVKSERRPHIRRVCSRDEFEKFIAESNMKELHAEWEDSGYNHWLKPSIDSIFAKGNPANKAHKVRQAPCLGYPQSH